MFTTSLSRRLPSLPTTMKCSRLLSSSAPKIEKCRYDGPSAKPSMLMQNHLVDTSVWNDVPVLDSDIFINTPAKAGTTWTQEIVSQLLYNGDLSSVGGSGVDVSIWTAMKLPSIEKKVQMMAEQAANPKIPRRIIKTHEPVETVPFKAANKHLFVGRDYRDIVWSWYSHHRNFHPDVYSRINAPTDYAFKPLPTFNFSDGSFTEYDMWKMMLSEGDDHGNPDGWPLYSQLWIAGSWWNIRNEPNVKLIHYNDLKRDLAGSMREIAAFFDIEIDEENFDQLVDNCTFQSMKNRKNPMGSSGSMVFQDPSKFFNKGETKRWQNVLTEQDTEEYRELAKRYLDDEGIHWLETGERQ